MRHPIVAGSFYSPDKEELEKEIEGLFKRVKNNRKIEGIKALIVPHAGYFYSGEAGAYAYDLIKNEKFDSFVILGTNHTGIESGFAVSMQDFETPLGVAKNDIQFSKMLIKNADKDLNLGDTPEDRLAEKTEHSIEVQIPFLQYLFQEIKIVPVIVRKNSEKNYKEFAKLILETAKKLNRKICVIASSDMTHYGKAYGFVPFKENIKENLYKLDSEAIKYIIKKDTDSFLRLAENTTICGEASISCVIEIAKLLNLNAELVKYYISGDILGDYENSVGYASIIFSKI